jgi:hypothetical protein
MYQINIARGKEKWRAVVNTVMNFHSGSIKCGKFLDSLRNHQLVKKDPAA